MALRDLENRVAQLEAHVERLRADVRSSQSEGKPAWQKTIEKFADDEDLLAIFSDAMKLREAERKKARNGRKARKP